MKIVPVLENSTLYFKKGCKKLYKNVKQYNRNILVNVYYCKSYWVQIKIHFIETFEKRLYNQNYNQNLKKESEHGSVLQL